ncbi:MAG: hypothetical protein KDA25_05120 [Phycisphaerales bacterium]|nr:hypothetical protein [Phycisphaerales bacterium]
MVLLLAAGAAGAAPARDRAPTIVMPASHGTAPWTLFAHAADDDRRRDERIASTYRWTLTDGQSEIDAVQGWNVAWTLDAPGTYEVVLDVIDSRGVAARAVRTVEVEPPDGRVRLVAPPGAGGDDPESPTSLAGIMATLVDGDVVLLPRGAMFDLTEPLTINRSRVRLGAYGTGMAPVLRWIGDQITPFGIIEMTGDVSDVIVEDVVLRSVWAGERDGVRGVRPNGHGITVRRCAFRHVADAVNSERVVERLLVQHCTAEGLAAYFAFGQGSDHVYLDNVVVGSIFEHNLRFVDCERFLVARNELWNGPKSCIWMLRGRDGFAWANELHGGQLSIGPNHVAGAPADRFVGAGAVENVSMDLDIVGPAIQTRSGAEFVVIAGNVIWRDGDTAIGLAGYDEGLDRTSRAVRIVDNVAINMSEHGRFLDCGPGVSGVGVIGNTYLAPNLVTGSYRTAVLFVLDADLRGFSAIGGNLWPIPSDAEWVPDAVHYLWPYWSEAAGYHTIEQWEVYPQTGDDQYEVVSEQDVAGLIEPD